MASNLLKNNESIYNLLKYFNNKMKCSFEIFNILEKYEKKLVNFYSIKYDKAKYKIIKLIIMKRILTLLKYV